MHLLFWKYLNLQVGFITILYVIHSCVFVISFALVDFSSVAVKFRLTCFLFAMSHTVSSFSFINHILPLLRLNTSPFLFTSEPLTKPMQHINYLHRYPLHSCFLIEVFEIKVLIKFMRILHPLFSPSSTGHCHQIL